MNRWALIVGARGPSKASLCARVLGELARRGVPVAGVVQESIAEGDDRVGYLARRAGRGDAVPIARKGTARAPQEEAFCSFAFDPRAFAEVRRWLAEDARPGGVVLIDEISKLEASGGGHHDAILDALKGPALTILVVRADQLFFVVEKLGLLEPVASLETDAPRDLDAFVSEVALAVGAP